MLLGVVSLECPIYATYRAMRSRRGCRTGRRTTKKAVFVTVRRGSSASTEHPCSLATAAKLFQSRSVPGGRLFGNDESILLLKHGYEPLDVALPGFEGGTLAEDENERVQPFVFHIDRQAHFAGDRGVRHAFNVPDVDSTFEAEDTFLLTGISTVEGTILSHTRV